MKDLTEIRTPRLQPVATVFVVVIWISAPALCLTLGAESHSDWLFFGGPPPSTADILLLSFMQIFAISIAAFGLSGHYEQVNTSLKNDGIRQRRVLGADRFISWEEITRVEEMQWVLVINSTSEEIRILPHLFKNPPSVQETILERLSAREDVTTVADSAPKN